MPRPLKIALTGAHGTGKTTLSNAIFTELSATKSVERTAEIPRLFIEEVGDQKFFQRGRNTFTRQCMIVARQIELEGTLARRPLDVLICDRTVVDHWAYTEVLFPDEVKSVEGQCWKGVVRRWQENYDEIVRLPIAFSIEMDGVREADLELQREVDAKIVNLYRDFGRCLPTVEGSIAERQRAMIDIIRRQLQ